LIADWMKGYNQVRPHSSLHYKQPAPEAKTLVTLTLHVVPFLGAGHLLNNGMPVGQVVKTAHRIKCRSTALSEVG